MVPQIDAPMVRIRVEIPKEVQMSYGEKAWTGALGKGEEKVLQMGILLSDELPPQIYGFASIEYPDGTKMTKSAVVNLGSPDGLKKKMDSQPPVKKNRSNENVIEFPGEVPGP